MQAGQYCSALLRWHKPQTGMAERVDGDHCLQHRARRCSGRSRWFKGDVCTTSSHLMVNCGDVIHAYWHVVPNASLSRGTQGSTCVLRVYYWNITNLCGHPLSLTRTHNILLSNAGPVTHTAEQSLRLEEVQWGVKFLPECQTLSLASLHHELTSIVPEFMTRIRSQEMMVRRR